MATTTTKSEAVAKLDEILAKLDALHAAVESVKAAKAPAPAGPPGTVFPNYGRSKGMPIAGAPLDALQYYRAGAERTLADASKERWHDKERQLLAAIDAEIARQSGGASPATDEIPF